MKTLKKLKKKLKKKLLTQSVNNMFEDNILKFIECGPGRVLQGLVKKINRKLDVSSL